MKKRLVVICGVSALLAMSGLGLAQNTPSTSGMSSAMGSGKDSAGTSMHRPGSSGFQTQPGQQSMTQEHIRQAQEQLRSAGFNPGPIDGILGEGTRAALREFQQTYGLPATGELDQATSQQLMAQASQESPGMDGSRESIPGRSDSGGALPGSTTSGQYTPPSGTPRDSGSSR
ncbi:MAG: peptidoglycan-binding protein [Candidatus Tectimicrobiota bacterium]